MLQSFCAPRFSEFYSGTCVCPELWKTQERKGGRLPFPCKRCRRVGEPRGRLIQNHFLPWDPQTQSPVRAGRGRRPSRPMGSDWGAWGERANTRGEGRGGAGLGGSSPSSPPRVLPAPPTRLGSLRAVPSPTAPFTPDPPPSSFPCPPPLSCRRLTGPPPHRPPALPPLPSPLSPPPGRGGAASARAPASGGLGHGEDGPTAAQVCGAGEGGSGAGEGKEGGREGARSAPEGSARLPPPPSVRPLRALGTPGGAGARAPRAQTPLPTAGAGVPHAQAGVTPRPSPAGFPPRRSRPPGSADPQRCRDRCDRGGRGVGPPLALRFLAGQREWRGPSLAVLLFSRAAEK